MFLLHSTYPNYFWPRFLISSEVTSCILKPQSAFILDAGWFSFSRLSRNMPHLVCSSIPQLVAGYLNGIRFCSYLLCHGYHIQLWMVTLKWCSVNREPLVTIHSSIHYPIIITYSHLWGNPYPKLLSFKETKVGWDHLKLQISEIKFKVNDAQSWTP